MARRSARFAVLGLMIGVVAGLGPAAAAQPPSNDERAGAIVAMDPLPFLNETIWLGRSWSNQGNRYA